MRRQLVRRLPGIRVTPLHGRRHGNEMQVVRVVHQRIHALRAGSSDVGLVHFCRIHIRHFGCIKIASADVSVRWHMHQMPRPWR